MKNSAISPLIDQFALQTRLFSNTLKDVESNNYNKQPNSHTNNLAWLAGHVLNTRTNLANLIGLKLPTPYGSIYNDFKPFDSKVSYPPVEDVRKGWQELSTKLIARLEDLNDNFINSAPPFKVPVGDNTMKGFIAFFAHHEAYHIGQLGFLRKYFGYPPMSYD